MKNIKTSVLVIFCFCLCNTFNIKNAIEQSPAKIDISFGGQNTESQNTDNAEGEINLINKDWEQSDGEEDLVIDSEKSYVKFELEYPNGYPGIDDDEFDLLYNRIFYIGKENIDEIIKSDITTWLNSCTINSSLDNVFTESENRADYYSNIEERFSNNNLSSSSLLDEVINGRKELMGKAPNGTLAWLLANNMQTYALNYENQTNNENCILYSPVYNF